MKREEWAQLVEKHKYLISRNPDAEFSRISPALLTAVRYNNPKMLTTASDGFKLGPENFCDRSMVLLKFEKLHSDIMMRKFDKSEVFIELDDDEKSRGGNEMYKFELYGLKKGHPQLGRGDLIILDDGENHPEQFKIENIVGDVIKFRRLTRSSRNLINVPFNMSFHSLNTGSKRCMSNLHQVKGRERIQKMLFMGTRHRKGLEANSEDKSIEPVVQQVAENQPNKRLENLENRLKTKCNERQRLAITNIIEGKCRPSLYILFGPPGTGKTATLIEATGQIFQRNPDAKILLCAQTNNCVDDLAQKLVEAKTIKEAQLIRLCSEKYFNYLVEREAPIPSIFTVEVDVARKKRIVITTNLMTPKLNQQYDFVFMDEASHANIPNSLLPCSQLKDEGCFVLSGDPKQLGPVVQSRQAAAAGLGESLMWKIFTQETYGQHQGEYDPRFLTKLVVSYRCDPRLMELNNKEFYRNELEFRGQTPADLLEKLELERPTAFKRVHGTAQNLGGNYSPSWKNELEADECIEFLFKLYWIGLKPEQVGIITYYSLQKAIIMEKFEERLKKEESKLNAHFKRKASDNKSKGSNVDKQIHEFSRRKLTEFKRQPTKSFDWHCKIDTVDAFQGNERDVIIISTTITSKNEFLNDPRRFNVATSRARWITMVIGHPDLETFCRLWKRFTNQAYRA